MVKTVPPLIWILRILEFPMDPLLILHPARATASCPWDSAFRDVDPAWLGAAWHGTSWSDCTAGSYGRWETAGSSDWTGNSVDITWELMLTSCNIDRWWPNWHCPWISLEILGFPAFPLNPLIFEAFCVEERWLEWHGHVLQGWWSCWHHLVGSGRRNLSPIIFQICPYMNAVPKKDDACMLHHDYTMVDSCMLCIISQEWNHM